MNELRARAIIDHFSECRVVVVGDVCIDQYIHGVVERLNPEAPVPILHAETATESSGAAGNVAKNAAQLGAATALVSVVGADAAARRVAETARRERYRLYVTGDKSRPTIRKVRHVVGGQQLLRVDYEKTHDISGSLEKLLLRSVDKVVAQGVDAIIISDYAKGVITQKVAASLVRLAKRKKLMLAADVKPSRAAYVRGASFVSPNLKEAHEYVGINPYEQGGRAPAQLAKLLRKKMKADVYITLGAQGMYVSAGSQVASRVPQEHVVEVFDVSGAGDTALVMLTLALLSGATPPEAAQLANAAGAVVVGKIGSVGLSQDELLDMIAHKHL